MNSRYQCFIALTLIVGSFLLIVNFSGCGREDRPAGSTVNLTSHERMKAELVDAAKDAAVNNEYSQTITREKARAQLQALPATQVGKRINLLQQLYSDELRLGEPRKAIERLEEANALLDKHGITIKPEQRLALSYSLAVGWLRVGETENCIECRTGESCILPIQEGGRHSNPEGSRKAMEYFIELLDETPEQVSAIWLLNIAAMTIGEYPHGVPKPYRISESVFDSKVEFPRFTDIAAENGLKVVNTGGGSIAEDFDRDGYIDVLTSEWDPQGQLRYFRNTGDGQFKELTSEAGLTGIVGGINMVQADYNNDGLVDIYIMRGAWLSQHGRYPNSLLKNLGGNRFQDVTFDVGLGAWHPTATAAWGDYDNDGDVDLYVPNEDSTAHLYRNEGASGFIDVAQEAGVMNGRFGKGVVWGDYNGDNLLDLFISNFEGENRLYRNKGDGTFADMAPELGLTSPNVSFPTWFWDANGDGHLDIYVASYHANIEHVAAEALQQEFDDEPDALYINDGDGKFIESAREFGLTRTTKPMGANFGDLNNDGLSDFYLGTGSPFYVDLMPNLMFLNRDGTRFDDVTYPGGFGMLQKGHGISFADFDNDGDLDIFAQTGGAYPGDAFGNMLYENPGFGNHFLRIELVGRQSNRMGIGCRIRALVRDGGRERSIYHWVGSGGSFGGKPACSTDRSGFSRSD